MKLKHSLMTLALATVGCLGLASLPVAAAATGEEFAKASDDGAWCWFSEPKAVRRDGKVFTGWVTRNGSIEASVIDAKGQVLQTAMLHEKLQLDDHDNPAFLFLADGRLAAFYCTHGNDDLFLRITEKPGMVFKYSAPSWAGTGWRGALASVTVTRGSVGSGAVTSTVAEGTGLGGGFFSWSSAAARGSAQTRERRMQRGVRRMGWPPGEPRGENP